MRFSLTIGCITAAELTAGARQVKLGSEVDLK